VVSEKRCPPYLSVSEENWNKIDVPFMDDARRIADIFLERRSRIAEENDMNEQRVKPRLLVGVFVREDLSGAIT
jgi:hypothetical protein